MMAEIVGMMVAIVMTNTKLNRPKGRKYANGPTDIRSISSHCNSSRNNYGVSGVEKGKGLSCLFYNGNYSRFRKYCLNGYQLHITNYFSYWYSNSCPGFNISDNWFG